MEATLLMVIGEGPPSRSALRRIDPDARIHPDAVVGEGTTVGPFAVIGPGVRIGRDCTIGASSMIEGHTTIGDGTVVFPHAPRSAGAAGPEIQGRSDAARDRRGNIFREFVTIHRGTAGGGGVTTIGDRNLFMNYVHVAHDCHVGSNTIFGPHATLGGHVLISDFVNVSAGSAVHHFCRVGAYAFIGGYSVITKDALPMAAPWQPSGARVRLNLIGLKRRGFTDDTLKKLRAAYRYLTQPKLNTTQAVAKIASDPSLKCPEVDNLVDFIRTAQRGVIPGAAGKRPTTPKNSHEITDERSSPSSPATDAFPFTCWRPRVAGSRRHHHRDQGRSVEGSRKRRRPVRRGAICIGSRSVISGRS